MAWRSRMRSMLGKHLLGIGLPQTLLDQGNKGARVGFPLLGRHLPITLLEAVFCLRLVGRGLAKGTLEDGVAGHQRHSLVVGFDQLTKSLNGTHRETASQPDDLSIFRALP